jgi:hypothetical protein
LVGRGPPRSGPRRETPPWRPPRCRSPCRSSRPPRPRECPEPFHCRRSPRARLSPHTRSARVRAGVRVVGVPDMARLTFKEPTDPVVRQPRGVVPAKSSPTCTHGSPAPGSASLYARRCRRCWMHAPRPYRDSCRPYRAPPSQPIRGDGVPEPSEQTNARAPSPGMGEGGATGRTLSVHSVGVMLAATHAAKTRDRLA